MFEFNTEILFWSAIVFVAMMAHVLTGTVRLIMMVKGRKALAVIVGFFEAAIGITNIILVISNAVRSGINIFIILFYAIGFAAGLTLGMLISQKISKDILSINIVTKNQDTSLADLLRSRGFGVTCYEGSGREGNLKVLNVVCQKTKLLRLKKLVTSVDEKAMLTIHTLEGLSGGFIFDIKNRI